MPGLRSIFVTIGIAVIYGLGLRLLISNDLYTDTNFGQIAAGVMSFSFLVLVPMVVGFITVYLSRNENPGWLFCIFVPWVSIIIMIAASFYFYLEGLICIVMALPIFFMLASIGGIIAKILKDRNRNVNTLVLCSFLLLPLVSSPIEKSIDKPKEIITVQTATFISAENAEVWDNIVKVHDITPDETPSSLFLQMGFPRPIKAELDRNGIGGVRKAIFDKGLFFKETVTQWDSLHSFTFKIEADPNSIPPEALDEHVTVGGEYFDVLEGKYEIENKEGGVMLHLTSKFRLSTGLNFYSGIWGKAIMKDIQDNILEIVKNRCEKNQ